MKTNWKKVGKFRWRKDREFIQFYQGNWKNQGIKNIVAFGNLDKLYYEHRKFFKTKSQALKFAKAYMKKH